ncbi:MAG TPA: phage tail tape measure protein [Candidatus Deferrimicrobiaceae bacterium]|nr:phage tail tape measure protein [Candidatus Deferrimicrobiaceae bacterium]
MAGKNEVKLTFAGDADKLDKETRKVGSSTDEMADKVGNASKKMASDTDRASKDGQKSFDMLGKAAVGLGAVMATAGAQAVAAFTSSLEFDSARAKLDAQIGDSAFAGELGRVAGDLYSKGFGAGIGEMNEAVRAVVGSGALMEDATNEQIGSITEQVHSLAEAFDQDLGQTMRAVGKAVKTGLVADAQEGLDVITRGLQQNVDEAGDLVDTFNEYSTQFREVGLSGAQSMGLLVQGLKAGARDADVVADSIKEFTLRMKDGSVETAKGFKMVGLNGQEMMAKFAQGGPAANEVFTTMLQHLNAIHDPLKRDEAALALFGTKAEDMGEALFALDPGTAAAGLGELGGATQRLSDTLGDTVENRVKVAKREFENWTQSIAGVEGPIGSAAVGMMAFGGDALGLAANLGMAVMALQSFGLFAKIATAAQWLWNIALSANPIGLVILAIAALVGGFIWLWNNVEGFRNFFIGVGEALVTAWTWVTDKISEGFRYIQAFVEGTKAKWSSDLAAIGGFFTNMGYMIIGVWDWIVNKVNAVIDFFKSIPSRIANALGGLGNAIGNAFTSALNWGIDKINWFIDRANSIIAGVNNIPGVSISMIPKMGRLHDGGVVPGFAGQERMAILEAGETVVPADRSPAMSGSGSAPTSVVFGSDGSAFGDAMMQVVLNAIRRAGGDPSVLGV